MMSARNHHPARAKTKIYFPVLKLEYVDFLSNWVLRIAAVVNIMRADNDSLTEAKPRHGTVSDSRSL